MSPMNNSCRARPGVSLYGWRPHYQFWPRWRLRSAYLAFATSLYAKKIKTNVLENFYDLYEPVYQLSKKQQGATTRCGRSPKRIESSKSLVTQNKVHDTMMYLSRYNDQIYIFSSFRFWFKQGSRIHSQMYANFLSWGAEWKGWVRLELQNIQCNHTVSEVWVSEQLSE